MQPETRKNRPAFAAHGYHGYSTDWLRFKYNSYELHLGASGNQKQKESRLKSGQGRNALVVSPLLPQKTGVKSAVAILLLLPGSSVSAAFETDEESKVRLARASATKLHRGVACPRKRGHYGAVSESHMELLYSGVSLPQQCSSMLASVALISQEFHFVCMTMTKLRLQCMNLGRVSH